MFSAADIFLGSGLMLSVRWMFPTNVSSFTPLQVSFSCCFQDIFQSLLMFGFCASSYYDIFHWCFHFYQVAIDDKKSSCNRPQEMRLCLMPIQGICICQMNRSSCQNAHEASGMLKHFTCANCHFLSCLLICFLLLLRFHGWMWTWCFLYFLSSCFLLCPALLSAAIEVQMTLSWMAAWRVEHFFLHSDCVLSWKAA